MKTRHPDLVHKSSLRQHLTVSRNVVCAAGVALLLSACQLNLADRVAESSIVSGIRNLPSTVLPGQFDSTAYIDSDFDIPNAALAADGQHTVIKTFFATNRQQRQSAAAYSMFGDTRSSEGITFGKSYVILPRSGDTIDIEPEALIRVQLGENSMEPESLAHNEIYERQDFSSEISREIEQASSGSALIYVHDFNVGFEAAALQSAQLSYDLGFPGMTYFFSWPARGGVASYIADTESMQASRANFRTMMNEILYLTPTDNVYIVAKGMGARLVSEALKQKFIAQPDARSRIREIILVTPDISKDKFANDLAPYLGSKERPVTLYASSNSNTLATAKSLSDAPLAGDASDSLLIAPLVESINTGNASTSLAGHASYSSPDSIHADIWDLISHGTRADSRRWLSTVYSREGTYWQFRQR